MTFIQVYLIGCVISTYIGVMVLLQNKIEKGEWLDFSRTYTGLPVGISVIPIVGWMFLLFVIFDKMKEKIYE